MEFSNTQVDSQALPDVSTLHFEPLERDYLKLLLVYVSISNLVLILGLTIFLIVKPFFIPIWLIITFICLITLRVIWSYTRTFKSFPHKAFALREKDIIYKSGWMWRQMVTVPFNRVQHLQVDQGLIERQLKLAKLKIFTAGGSSSDITIPGLRPETAARLKQFVVAKTGEDEEE